MSSSSDTKKTDEKKKEADPLSFLTKIQRQYDQTRFMSSQKKEEEFKRKATLINEANTVINKSLRKYQILFLICGFVLALMLASFLFFGHVIDKTQVIAMIFCIIAVFVVFSYLFITKYEPIKSAQEIKEDYIRQKEREKVFTFLVQLRNIAPLILYIIGLIAVFANIPTETMSHYAYFFVILSLIGYAFVFLYASKSNITRSDKKSGDQINVRFERYRWVILLLLFAITCIIYYIQDPGKIISTYFQSSFMFVGIFGILMSLYVFMMFVNTYESQQLNSSITNATKNKLSTKSIQRPYFMMVSSIVLLVVTGVFFYYYFTHYKATATSNDSMNFANMLALLVFVLIIPLIGLAIYSQSTEQNKFSSNLKSNVKNYESTNKAILVLFGMVMLAVAILWIFTVFNNVTGTPISIITIIINIIIILIVLWIIFNAFRSNDKFKALLESSGSANMVPNAFQGVKSGMEYISDQYQQTNSYHIMALIISIGLIAIYYGGIPAILAFFENQNGKILVRDPVSLTKQTRCGTFETLNSSTTPSYQYAISIWVFINAFPENTNTSYTRFSDILNYGGKPRIAYNGRTNTLRITVAENGNDNSTTTVYEDKNFKLQKWNNIVINYAGGTMDVFVNGVLEKSNINVSPYLNLDELTVGENSDNTLKGEICNVKYVPNPMTNTSILTSYYLLKNQPFGK